MIRYISIALLLSGCTPVQIETSMQAATATVCALTESDLPDRFRSSAVDVTAEALRIMCRAQALRDGTAPSFSFAQMETTHFDCEATIGFAYAAADDPFRVDWYEVCGG